MLEFWNKGNNDIFKYKFAFLSFIVVNLVHNTYFRWNFAVLLCVIQFLSPPPREIYKIACKRGTYNELPKYDPVLGLLLIQLFIDLNFC